MIAALLQRRAAARSQGTQILFFVGLGVLVVGVVAIAWIVITGLVARSHLNHVRAELPQLRSALTTGDMSKAHALARDIDQHARQAHDLTTGPAWWVAANIPAIGTPLQTSRTIAAQADRVAQDVVPGVLDLADDLTSMSHLSDSTIDLDKVAAAAPRLRSAASAAHWASRAVDASAPSWFGYVSSARSSVVSELHELDDELSGASRSIQVLLPMLGQSGVQRYMIGFMNEAESRGLGGIPGAFAIVTADHGKITFTHFGSDDELRGVRAKVKLGADFDARYSGDDPAGVFPNSDLSPDFRNAAQIWAGMWEQKTGQHLDGALAVDPTALSYLLKVTGPATLPDGSKVSAADVVALTQQKQYAMYPSGTPHDKAERKAYLATLAKAVSEKLTKGGNGTALVRALSHAAQERRLVVWSADPAIEQLIVAGGWGGVLDGHGAPFSGFVVNNAAGSKLDYYLHVRSSYRRADCGPGGHSLATITLDNHAPRTGLPPYVTARGDAAPASARPGDNRVLVTYYATKGSILQSATVDGKPKVIATMLEGGLVTATVDLELSAGKPRTVQFVYAEPATTSTAKLLRQPMVNPVDATADDKCG